MAEILFGQSYYLRFDPKLWEAMQPYPPLGTLYAASLRARARLRRGPVRRHAGRLRAALGRGAGPPPAALRRALRGQLQLPEQDVPAAHARGSLHHDRHGQGARLHGHRLRRRRHRPRRPTTSSTAWTTSCWARARSPWASCWTRLTGRSAASRSSRSLGLAILSPFRINIHHCRSSHSHRAHPSATWTACRSRPGIWSTLQRTAGSGASDTATTP